MLGGAVYQLDGLLARHAGLLAQTNGVGDA
jgi:hypothetical protein